MFLSLTGELSVVQVIFVFKSAERTTVVTFSKRNKAAQITQSVYGNNIVSFGWNFCLKT